MIESFNSLYPFKSNFLNLGVHKYHYLDEGKGDALVMAHGNPTWSFYFRHLVTAMRDEYRVIVPDHIGCGLSDKPQDYEYVLSRHIDNLEALIDNLGLKEVTLVLHDWGGAIGMGWAVRNPERLRRIVVFNTAAFLLPYIPFRIRICRIPGFGDIAIRVFNAFAGMAVRVACKKGCRMCGQVKSGYLYPYDSYRNRIGNLRFVQDIPLSPKDKSYPVVKEIESKLDRFRKLPVLIVWGERDFCFNKRFLKRWIELFPFARVKVVSDAGHYVVEDAWERIIPWMKDFLAASQAV